MARGGPSAPCRDPIPCRTTFLVANSPCLKSAGALLPISSVGVTGRRGYFCFLLIQRQTVLLCREVGCSLGPLSGGIRGVACSLRHVVIMSIMAHADTHDSNVGVRTQVRKIVRADGPSVLLHMGFIDATRVHKLLPKLGRPSRINLWEERGIRAIG